MIQDTKDRFLYILIKLIILLLSSVPRKLMNTLAIPLGNLWYRMDKHHRDIALDNMENAFKGEIDEALLPGKVKSTFIQVTTVALEIPSLLKLDKDNLGTYVTFEGSHHLRTALSKGRGVLFLTAHLGNWELMALATTLQFRFRCHLLVRPLDFTPLDKIITEIRCRTGNAVLDKIRSARAISGILRKNEILAILMDQSASWSDGVQVPFFGRPAWTNKGFAIFALRYSPTILPIFNIRQPDGRYKIILDAPVQLKRSGNINRDIVQNTILFNQIIEKHIRMAPENWLWVHRRWRERGIPVRAKQKMETMTFSGLEPQ